MIDEVESSGRRDRRQQPKYSSSASKTAGSPGRWPVEPRSFEWPHQSKVELQSELNHARISGRCDCAEGRITHHPVRVPERRRVRQIENLRAEFEVYDLAEIRSLDKCDVRRAVTWAAHRVARGVPDRKLWRDREGRRVEPTAGRPLIRGQIRVAKYIRPLCAESREGVEVRDLRDGEWQPRLQQDRAVDAPASEQFVGDPREVESPPLPDRQFVGEARDKDVRNVASRDVAFERAVEAVGDREIADRTGLDARVKNLTGVVDQLRARVADEERQPSRKTLFELRLQRVIARVADVVAIEADGRETREGSEQLRARNGRVAQ